MARRKRRKFTQQFKDDAVRLVTSGSKTIAEVTKQFDLTETYRAPFRSPMHDDIWVVRMPEQSTGWHVRRMRTDTTQSTLFDPARTALFLRSGAQDEVSAWRMSAANPRDLTGLVRNDGGWAAAGRQGSPERLACAPEDTLGGRLCSASSAWWSAPGAVPCGSESATTCMAHDESLGWQAEIVRSGKPEDISLGAAGLWVVTAKALERWSYESAPRRLASLTLSGKGRGVAAASGGALVVGDDGVRWASITASGFNLSNTTRVHGRALNVAHLGDSVWIVSTTLGYAVVEAGRVAAPAVLASFSIAESGHAPPQLRLEPIANVAVDDKLNDAAVASLRRTCPVLGIQGGRVLLGPFRSRDTADNP